MREEIPARLRHQRLPSQWTVGVILAVAMVARARTCMEMWEVIAEWLVQSTPIPSHFFWEPNWRPHIHGAKSWAKKTGTSGHENAQARLAFNAGSTLHTFAATIAHGQGLARCCRSMQKKMARLWVFRVARNAQRRGDRNLRLQSRDPLMSVGACVPVGGPGHRSGCLMLPTDRQKARSRSTCSRYWP